MSRSKEFQGKIRCVRQMLGLRPCASLEDSVSNRGRDRCCCEDPVSDFHAPAEYAGKDWVQVGTAVSQTIEESREGEVCLCCGAWFQNPKAAFPYGASWRRFIDGQVSEEALARRHLALIRRGLYACLGCGSVWFENGQVFGEDRRSLSLLAGVRFSGYSDFERQARREVGY